MELYRVEKKVPFIFVKKNGIFLSPLISSQQNANLEKKQQLAKSVVSMIDSSLFPPKSCCSFFVKTFPTFRHHFCCNFSTPITVISIFAVTIAVDTMTRQNCNIGSVVSSFFQVLQILYSIVLQGGEGRRKNVLQTFICISSVRLKLFFLQSFATF